MNEEEKNEMQPNETGEEKMQEWRPEAGWFAKFWAWLFLLLIAAVLIWMIFQIFTPGGL